MSSSLDVMGGEWYIRNKDTTAELAFAQALTTNNTIRFVTAITAAEEKHVGPCFSPIPTSIGLALAQCLVGSTCCIETVELTTEEDCVDCHHEENSRCIIEPVVSSAIGAALWFNRTLSLLNLDTNNLGNDVCVIIAASLQVNTSLAELSLCGNKISSRGAESMASALKVNRHLWKLSLNNNKIGRKGVAALANALKINVSLCELQLDNNNNIKLGAVALSQMLESNTTLSKLSLKENNIDSAGGRALMAAMLVNTTLLQCKLENNRIPRVVHLRIKKAVNDNVQRRDTQPWSPKNHATFEPRCHIRFYTILLAVQRSNLPRLPAEIWAMHIFPYWRYMDVAGQYDGYDYV